MGIEYIPFGAGGVASQARNPIHSYVDLAMPLGGLTITNSNGANAISAYTALSSPANALSGHSPDDPERIGQHVALPGLPARQWRGGSSTASISS
jgi:hypothetical protein